MDVIPVLDLSHGHAVHARRGERASYAPVIGEHGSGDDPAALAGALRDHLGIRRLYVADLDAITGAPAPDRALTTLAAVGLELWVDAGVRSLREATRILDLGVARVIVALETLPELGSLRRMIDRLEPARVAFSLDLRAGRPLAADPALAALDPAGIMREIVATGADTILTIDLARVGSEHGPDFELVRQLRAAAPGARLIAGGGVRGVADLESLADIGCDGALVATALHDGRITRADIQRVAGAERG